MEYLFVAFSKDRKYTMPKQKKNGLIIMKKKGLMWVDNTLFIFFAVL